MAWADAFTSPLPDHPLLWLEEPHLTKARILLARDSDGDARSALSILDALCEIAQRTCNIRFQIEILPLCALALDMQGRTGDALAALRQAVELAWPGGFVRAFADAGPRVRAMLLRLSGQGCAVRDDSPHPGRVSSPSTGERQGLFGLQDSDCRSRYARRLLPRVCRDVGWQHKHLCARCLHRSGPGEPRLHLEPEQAASRCSASR